MINNKTAARAAASGGGGPAVEQVIDVSNWTSTPDGSSTLTITAAEHGLDIVKGVNVMMKNEDGDYVISGTWGVMSVVTTVNENNDITINYPDTTGFDGKVVIY